MKFEMTHRMVCLRVQLAIQWSSQMGFGHEVWEVTICCRFSRPTSSEGNAELGIPRLSHVGDTAARLTKRVISYAANRLVAALTPWGYALRGPDRK
jgi:hypothetical protein